MSVHLTTLVVSARLKAGMCWFEAGTVVCKWLRLRRQEWC